MSRDLGRRCGWLILALGLGASSPTPVHAQMVLPGAVSPQPAGSISLDPGKTRPPEPGSVRPPGTESLEGRQLQLRGAAGLMAFERGKSLEISRLALPGEQIGRNAEPCRVEIGGGRIPVKPAAPTDGLLSFDVKMEACAFQFDVLDGAVRVRGQPCEITAAACRVDPTGIWGPHGASIGAEEAQVIEQARGAAEKDARDLFRALIAGAATDRARQKQIAAEQAGFSSRREEMCRDYAEEDRHGFCASRITQARAVQLSAEIHGTKSPLAKQDVRKPAPKPLPLPQQPAAAVPVAR